MNTFLLNKKIRKAQDLEPYPICETLSHLEAKSRVFLGVPPPPVYNPLPEDSFPPPSHSKGSSTSFAPNLSSKRYAHPLWGPCTINDPSALYFQAQVSPISTPKASFTTTISCNQTKNCLLSRDLIQRFLSTFVVFFSVSGNYYSVLSNQDPGPLSTK